MSRSLITGVLVSASAMTEDPDDIEGLIEIYSELPRESIRYRIGVPNGFLEQIMPDFWNQRVVALVDEVESHSYYTLIQIDEAIHFDISGKEPVVSISTASRAMARPILAVGA